MFREKLRAVEPMNQMMQGLRDDDLRNMAAHLAKLPTPKPADGPVDSVRMERARAVIEEHRCNFCHNPDYSGEQNVPRLAGQREDYLVKALREYKNNTRRRLGSFGGCFSPRNQRGTHPRSRLSPPRSH